MSCHEDIDNVRLKLIYIMWLSMYAVQLSQEKFTGFDQFQIIRKQKKQIVTVMI